MSCPPILRSWMREKGFLLHHSTAIFSSKARQFTSLRCVHDYFILEVTDASHANDYKKFYL